MAQNTQRGRGRPRPGSRPGPRSGPRRGTRADPVRRVAYDVLAAVDERDAYANLLLPALLRERGIEGRDAALATELTYGTLRGLQTYDAILDLCSDRPARDIDPPVREVLRLGAHQLLATRVAGHAAVATSVDLAKDVVGMRPAGFVNAVLRRVSTRDLDGWLAIITPDRSADPAGYLAAAYSYPRWIVTAFRDALGGDLDETEATLKAGNARPQTTLVAIPGISEPAELTAGDDEPTAAPWSPFGVIMPGGDPGTIPAVADGRAFVQDEASQLVALALAHAAAGLPDPTHTSSPVSPNDPASPADITGPWLDLCAGPGGKAALLAGLAGQAGPGTHLIGADLRPHRAALTGEHLCRLPSAAAIAADGRAGAWRPGTFARVLADVPCSGLGALRRRPEARWRKAPEDVEGLVPLQRELLNAALDAARPGGVVGYVTCTPHQDETEGVVAAVLAGRDGVTVLDAPAILADALGRAVPGVSRGPGGRYVQLWPHRHGTDALFLALLRRGPTVTS